ncbi:MAG: MFS transporter [Betaproteobacteria bacterium]|nr:MFS transporter [Betaproteobacteria bacterium]NCW38781.1 MFS transporter [Betaproteobacteria bacterium]
MMSALRNPLVLVTVLMAGGVLLITMGIRQSVGLFVGPLNTETGLGITSISLALAIGQFVWGAVQPVAGAAADHWGARPVLLVGLLVMALGCLLTPWMDSTLGLTLTLGVLSAAGAGACSFSVLIGAAAQRLSPQERGAASGWINAGGSLGQFVLAPVTQKLIQTLGWMGAMWASAAVTLLAIPMALGLVPVRPAAANSGGGEAAAGGGMRQAIAQAFADRSYWLLHLGFFTCGFHIAFLVTHLPTEIGLCGLSPTVASWSLAFIGIANIVGSVVVGNSINRYRSKHLLALMYGSRAVLVLWYLAMPKTEWVFYVFAVGLGLTWLATVPPTAAIVGKLFGVRYLSTLFGLTLLSHQVGGFLGAYLGGVALSASGDYQAMWWADIALAGLAALFNLPIREEPIKPQAA